ncbi:VCBS repeat-containing protein [Opitutaceae bacterium]|nr:VCBS repeat-containing protein [Opitutaceae bacterium]
MTPRLRSVRSAILLSLSAMPLVGGDAVSDSWPRHAIDNSSLGADGVRSADVNGDGLSDLVAGWEQGGVSRIYLMQRDGVARPDWKMIEVGVAPAVEDALLVDLDQDGAVDVVSSTEGQNQKMVVHWAPSDPDNYAKDSHWRTETLFANESKWMFAVSMDIDGKNGPDLVVGGKGSGATVGWLESPANPRDVEAWLFHPLTEVTWTMSIITADVDMDGVKDILVSDRKGTQEGVFWLRNPGRDSRDLHQAWSKMWIADDLIGATLIDFADVDGDGAAEVLVPHIGKSGQRKITQLDRTHNGVWQRTAVALPGTANTPKAVKVADINLDGRADLVVSFEKKKDPDLNGIIWLEQTNEGWVTHNLSGRDGIKFDLNLVIDIDGDGDLDVVNTEENDNARNGEAGLGLVWYENPTR